MWWQVTLSKFPQSDLVLLLGVNSRSGLQTKCPGSHTIFCAHNFEPFVNYLTPSRRRVQSPDKCTGLFMITLATYYTIFEEKICIYSCSRCDEALGVRVLRGKQYMIY